MSSFKLAAALFLASAGAAAAGPQGFAVHDEPQEVANVRFVTEDGTRMDMADFQGKVILLNVWATWCVPCREEMPTLDALQASLGSDHFEVVPLSVDRAGVPPVRRFYDEIGVTHLGMYVDKTMLSATALRTVGLPTTILIDAKGKELGRLVGPADWDDPEMVNFLKGYIDPSQ
ncbi:Thiol-disulfide isomerase or thioredoxin [Loktanella atrilutea]|uniref:Thiol-disulfide isomerase or thioredoxin n=1 Tax=Loktanella atrilutea TaxID=366533 RepID=A0A1M5EF16_LOKAT|nr:TlpA disulfide reductase family protein [Loktanella atrilutea]SHF77818.1 Thiol-disulfide isomerase or thioredoxin [Loktanella atrilutea]